MCVSVCVRACVRACVLVAHRTLSELPRGVSTESAKDGLSVTQIKTLRQLTELIHQDTRGDDLSRHNTLSASDHLKTQNRTRNGKGKD